MDLFQRLNFQFSCKINLHVIFFRWATVTIILMFLPSIVGSMFTLATPERWPSDEPFDQKNMRFLALNLWHVFAFPFAAIYR